MADARMNPEGRRAIAEAVGRAEAGTSGEIVCVLAPEADDYAEIPVAWAAAAALVIPFLLVFAGLHPSLHVPWLGAGWSEGGVAGMTPVLDLTSAYVAMQALVFGLVFGVLQVPALRRALTPGPLKRAKVKKAAASQFLSTGLAGAADRTGVLIYASLHDRMVEVIADRLIHEKVGDAVWDAAVAAVERGMKRRVVGGGFVEAADICGQALAQHFPPTGPKANAFSDDLREV